MHFHISHHHISRMFFCDLTVMRNSLASFGCLQQWKPVGHVDSLAIAKALITESRNFKLLDLAQTLGLGLFDAHDAGADALASWHVLRATLNRAQAMQCLFAQCSRFEATNASYGLRSRGDV